MYAFVEVTDEVSPEGFNAGLIRDCYDELMAAFKNGEGLPAKEWNAWLDGYLAGKAGDPDEWERMNANQKLLINEVKKSRKRTNK